MGDTAKSVYFAEWPFDIYNFGLGHPIGDAKADKENHQADDSAGGVP